MDPEFRAVGLFMYEYDSWDNSKRLCAPCDNQWMTYCSRDAPFIIEDYFYFYNYQGIQYTNDWLDFWYPGASFDVKYGDFYNKLKLNYRRANF